MIEDVLPPPHEVRGSAPVTVMWRPGCPFCALLLRRLERTGLAFDRVDIWEHPTAAAWVRSVTGGDETVPTVCVVAGSSDRAVALVNPSVTQVIDVLGRVAPGALTREAAGSHRGSRPSTTGLASRFVGLLRGRRGRARGRGAWR